MRGLEPVDARPAAYPGVEYNGVEARDADAALVALERERPADELGGGRVNRGEVAQVELQGEDVDAGGRVGGLGAPCPQLGRGGGLVEVPAQLGGGLGGFAGVTRGGDEDEVGGQGARGKELVDEALADAQADATVDSWSEYSGLLNGAGSRWYLPVCACHQGEEGVLGRDVCPRCRGHWASSSPGRWSSGTGTVSSMT